MTAFPLDTYPDSLRPAVSRQDRADLIALPGGRHVAVPHPPDVGGRVTSTTFLLGAVAILHELDEAITAAARDPHLSDVGRAAKTSEPKTAAIKRLANVADQLGREQARAERLMEELFAVPQLDRADAVGVAEDAEIRRWWRGLDAAARADLLRDIQTGGSPRIALALARSPIPLADDAAVVVREAWKAAARSLRPVEVGGVELGLANAKWAADTLPTITRTAAELAGFDRRHVFGLLTDEHGRKADVLRAFGFDPAGGEVAGLRAAHEKRVA